MQESKELKYASISEFTDRPAQEIGKFMNEIHSANVFQFRPVRISIFGSEMVLPFARKARAGLE